MKLSPPVKCYTICGQMKALSFSNEMDNHHSDRQDAEFYALLALANGAQLQQSRLKTQNKIYNTLNQTPAESFALREEEKYLSLRLMTVEGQNFAGQFIEDQG